MEVYPFPQQEKEEVLIGKYKICPYGFHRNSESKQCTCGEKEEVMSADKGEGKLPSDRISEIYEEILAKDENKYFELIVLQSIIDYLDEQSKLSTKI